MFNWHPPKLGTVVLAVKVISLHIEVSGGNIAFIRGPLLRSLWYLCLMVASWNTSWKCFMECVMGCLMVWRNGRVYPIQAVQLYCQRHYHSLLHLILCILKCRWMSLGSQYTSCVVSFIFLYYTWYKEMLDCSSNIVSGPVY